MSQRFIDNYLIEEKYDYTIRPGLIEAIKEACSHIKVINIGAGCWLLVELDDMIHEDHTWIQIQKVIEAPPFLIQDAHKSDFVFEQYIDYGPFTCHCRQKPSTVFCIDMDF